MHRAGDTLQLIQIFRGAAAVSVMMYHLGMTNHFYSGYLGNAFGWGHAGVDFFFQLSGFIMLYVHWDQAGDARRVWRFWLLRAIRIYPIYWCALAATVALWWVCPPTPANTWTSLKTFDLTEIGWSALLWDPTNSIVGPAWTLVHEIRFYLFFGLYFLVGRTLFALLSLAWFGAIVAQWQGYLGWPYPVMLRLIVGDFFFGMLAAVIVRCWKPRRFSGWWVMLAVALWLVFARSEIRGLIDGYKWWAIPGFALLVTGGLYDRATTRAQDPYLLLIGDASYSIYLIHYGLIVLFAESIAPYRAFLSQWPETTLTILAALILLCGVMVHLWIERPLLRAARRYLWVEARAATAPVAERGRQDVAAMAESSHA